MAVLLAACGGARAGPAPQGQEALLEDCTVTVQPGEAIPTDEGAVVCLAAGVHAGRLDLSHSLTLRGQTGAILDGGGRGPVVRIGADGLQVVIEGLEIRNGAARFGSGVQVEGYSKVTLRGCTVSGNRRGEGGGTGLGARRGVVAVEGCAFGDEVTVTGTAQATFSGADLDELNVLDKAKVRLESTSVKRPVTLRGTTTSKPTLTLGPGVSAEVRNHDTVPGVVVRE